MPRLLKQLRIDEVSCVIKGANQGARVLIRKADDDPPYLFNDIMRKAAVDDDVTGDHAGDDNKKLSAKLDEVVAEMIVAAPSLHPNRARRWLLHTESGQRLLAQHTTKKENIMPQVDILKAATILEDALMATITKRDDETFAKAFTRKYENDIEFRRQWATVNEAKQQVALSKIGMATITPTSTGVGDTNVSDDSAEAVRLLQEMAEKQHRTFEQVFADPNNKALAGKTYTGAHRPTSSSTSGSELQKVDLPTVDLTPPPTGRDPNWRSTAGGW
jgi:hypothetical protein